MKAVPVIRDGKIEGYGIKCPSGVCGMHIFWTNCDGHPQWSFDGNQEEPTFSPSMLARWGNHVPGYEHLDAKEYGSGTCHSFVRNGKIEFLGDCSHQYAGQTMELEHFSEETQKRGL